MARASRTNGELLCAYRGHKNSDFRVESCFSSTDELVISGSEDGRIFVWKLLSNTVNSEEQASWKAHESVVTALARHPREEMLLSCSIDGLIKVGDGGSDDGDVEYRQLSLQLGKSLDFPSLCDSFSFPFNFFPLINTHTHTHIYIYREREREREMH